MKEIVLVNRNKYKILCIGEKGTAALAWPFPDLLINAITEVSLPLNFYNIASISNYIIKEFNNFDEY